MKKSEKNAFIGTIISSFLIVLILLFIYLPVVIQAGDEGMMISFGNASEGGGTGNETSMASQPASKVVREITEDDLMTQDEPSVAVIDKKKKQDNNEVVTRENARITAERLKKEQDAIEKAKAMDGMFGNNISGGSGNSSGDGMEGNPVGKGNEGGNSWSLGGRSLSGNLVSPAYEKNVEGRVTVQIRVDESGRVIGATIGSNTTISDQTTRNAAIVAAKNTRFSPGNGIASGTITYNFRLR